MRLAGNFFINIFAVLNICVVQRLKSIRKNPNLLSPKKCYNLFQVLHKLIRLYSGVVKVLHLRHPFKSSVRWFENCSGRITKAFQRNWAFSFLRSSATRFGMLFL